MSKPKFKSQDVPKWKFLLARLFGIKRVSEDSGLVLTFYYWNGKYWL